MVKRVKEPGTKFDFMVIIEGKQDIGKSLFCEDLAARKEWFTDTPVLNKDSKVQMEAIEGKWVIEAAELQGIGKAEVEKVKGFVTSTHDRERAAYAHFRSEIPRTCIIIGTTNEQFYLKDMTDNRRFWPVEVRSYDRTAFLRDRAQIFAEAVVLAETEKLWLDDPKLQRQAIRAQERRMEPNPYYEKLEDFRGTDVGDEERAHNHEVWAALGLDKTPTSGVSKAIAKAMRKHGWERRKVRIQGGEVPALFCEK
jgi:predicted P-loop ATPase